MDDDWTLRRPFHNPYDDRNLLETVKLVLVFPRRKCYVAHSEKEKDGCSIRKSRKQFTFIIFAGGSSFLATDQEIRGTRTFATGKERNRKISETSHNNITKTEMVSQADTWRALFSERGRLATNGKWGNWEDILAHQQRHTLDNIGNGIACA